MAHLRNDAAEHDQRKDTDRVNAWIQEQVTQKNPE
jgi:hypothetical protein